MIDDDTLLEIFDNGFVLYETDFHYTIFPFRDALKDYCYESVASDSKAGNQIPLNVFYDMPWVFRVLMEAEDRVVHNMYTSPAIENSASLEHVMDYLVKIRYASHDTLDIIFWKKLTEILKQSEKSLTDYRMLPRTHFAMLNKPVVSIKYGRMTFNMAAIRLFEGTVNILPMIHEGKRRLAAVPCSEEESASVEWSRKDKYDKWKNKEIRSEEFVGSIFELMGWNPKSR